MKNSTMRLVKDDLTAMDVEAIVFYARSDLKLGSGFGNAIAMRGGPGIQAELDGMGPLGVCDAVVTTAGRLRARYIVHAVGPKFQEVDTEAKLRRTLLRVLALAEEKGIRQIAMPPLGAGFYGVPLEVCAEIQMAAIEAHLDGGTRLREVIICAHDDRELTAFRDRLAKPS